MKITTEIQRNVKLQFRAKILRGYTGWRSRVRLRTALELLRFNCSKWSRIFQISLLIWTSKIPKMKLQTKEL